MQSRQGRPARAERSSRAKQFYDSEIEPVFDSDLGELTAREFKSKFSNSPKSVQFYSSKGNPKTTRFGRKSCACGGPIQYHADGRAVCGHCNTVFNDGGNIDGLLKITYKYDDKRPDVIKIPSAPPPKNQEKDHMRGMHRFIGACRA